jgi:hypothetical protein
MDDLTERIYTLRQQASSLAQDCLTAGELEAFQELNRFIVDLTRFAQRLPNGDHLPTPGHPVDKGAGGAGTPLLGQRIRIFKRYKGQVYEAEIDQSRIQQDGRGKCVLLNGNWLSASGSVFQITHTAVDGWVNFWRYQTYAGDERPIDDFRKTVRKA